MLQADCGYCSYYGPQDESATREMCSCISVLLFFFFRAPHLVALTLSFRLITLSVSVPSSHLQPSPDRRPLLYFCLRLLLILHLLFSCLNAHLHAHTHTHLSVICMRWFLMRLGPSGSSHSNLHQHPLPWLFVCLSLCLCEWVDVFESVFVRTEHSVRSLLLLLFFFSPSASFHFIVSPHRVHFQVCASVSVVGGAAIPFVTGLPRWF